MDQGNTFNTNVIIGGIIVIVVLVAGWWLTTKPAGEGSMATSTATDTSNTGSNTGSSSTTGANPSTIASGEAVTVRNQAAGDSVAVESVTLNQMGWVAIRDEDGRVLGAARFDAGTHANVSVPLLRGTVASSSYQVLLYVDDGDKEYDLHKDILITGAGGGVAGTTFKTL